MNKKYYYTLDTHGDALEKDAHIRWVEAPSEEEAKEQILQLLSQCDFLDENEKVVIREINFHAYDYWFEVCEPPTADDFSPFTADEVNVDAAGEYPGGNYYWVKPRVSIYYGYVEND